MATDITNAERVIMELSTRAILKPNFKRMVDGIPNLVVAIVQDYDTDVILMQGFANEEAWLKSLKTGMACFYSTLRKELWTKGETSGNFMKIIEVRVDCDGDSIIYMVKPQGDGVACNTQAPTCYYRSIFDGEFLSAPLAGVKESLELVSVEIHSDLI